MDELDRMLGDLPEEPIPPGLAASVRLAVKRRHRRRIVLRRAGASLLAALGLWLLWPGIAWAASNELFASGAPWLAGSLESLNAESLDLLGRLWSGALTMQGAIGSGLAISILLGALFVCCSIFLAIDRASWQPIPAQPAMSSGHAMSASGIQL